MNCVLGWMIYTFWDGGTAIFLGMSDLYFVGWVVIFGMICDFWDDLWFVSLAMFDLELGFWASEFPLKDSLKSYGLTPARTWPLVQWRGRNCSSGYGACLCCPLLAWNDVMVLCKRRGFIWFCHRCMRYVYLHVSLNMRYSLEASYSHHDRIHEKKTD